MTEDRKPPEGQSQQPPYVPIPAYYLQGEPDDQINLADYIRVLWRRKFLILLGTLLCALTAFVVTVMVPPVYQTRATLILQPPLFPTELTPAPLSVETLKTMLESDSIASKLRSQLLEKNVIQPDSPIEQIKDMLSVEIPAENEPGSFSRSPLPGGTLAIHERSSGRAVAIHSDLAQKSATNSWRRSATHETSCS